MPARQDLDTRVMAAALARRMFGDEHRTPIRIGRFLVLDRIGGGGMGTVFRAYDPELDRSVAVKLLRPDIARDDPSSARRMQREAMGLARLSHPNVVTIHEVGTSEGRTFLAMEHVQGVDLAQWMRTHPVGSASRFAVAMDLLQQAGRGLAAAHSAGLVHRDFKPSNVLIGGSQSSTGDNGRARVADFGLVRAASDIDTGAESDAMLATGGTTSGTSESRVTQAGALVGTLRYMSPEQQHGRGVDARSDQFSFCVTAWELLFGCLPWPDGPSNDPHEVPDDAPGWVVAVLARGLQFDPSARYPDMPALLLALSRDPGRRRRLWALGIGTASALVAGTATFAHHRATMCDDGPAELAQTWNDERRSAIAAHFAALGLTEHDDAWTRADAQMDSFARAWVSTWEDVCDAGRRRGEIAQETFHDATSCLEIRRVDLEASLLVLEDADRSTAAHAPEIAYALRAPTACGDRGHVADSLPLPTDPTSADAVLALSQELTRARVTSIAGDAESSLARLDAIAPAIAELDYVPLTLRADSARINAFRNLRQMERANELAQAAYWTALRTGDDAMASGFAGQLAFESASSGIEVAERWLAYARVHGERAGIGDLERSRLESVAARIAVSRGNNDAALEHLHEALVLGESAWGPRHPQNISIYHGLATVHRLRHEFVEATRIAREAFEIESAAFGDDSPMTTHAMQNLSAALSNLGEHEEALALARRVVAIRREWQGEHVDLAQALTDLGATASYANRPDEALAAHREAYALYTRLAGPDDETRLLCQHNLAQTLSSLNRLDEAEALQRDVVAAYERALGSDHPRVGSAHWGLGAILVEQGAFAEAHEQLARALAIYEKTYGPEHPETLDVRVSQATADFEAGDVDGAAARLAALLPRMTGPSHALCRGRALALQGRVLDRLGRRALPRP